MMLTPQEQSVARHLVGGCTLKNIAGFLGITEDTVKHHIKAILRKSGTRSSHQFAMKAIHSGAMLQEIMIDAPAERGRSAAIVVIRSAPPTVAFSGYRYDSPPSSWLARIRPSFWEMTVEDKEQALAKRIERLGSRARGIHGN
jgi:DNA-binding CsgD family transcriptional regulator